MLERRKAKEVIKEILRRSEDNHNVFTPFELCDEMLSKINIKAENNVLVMFNLEFLYVIKEKRNLDNVWFLTSDEFKKNTAIKLGIEENKILMYSYNKKILNTNMPKFDVIVGNPPYLKNVHLKFLELSFDLLNDNGKLIFLHPSTWLILLREGKTKQKYNLLKDKLKNYIKSIDFIDSQQWFGKGTINPYVPLEIINIDKNNKNNIINFLNIDKKEQYIEDINDINLIGKYNIIKSIEHKIKNKSKYTIKNFINIESKNYFVNLNWIVGGGFMTIKFYDEIERKYSNLYNLVNNLSNKITKEPLRSKPKNGKDIGNLKNWVSFDTEKEAQNFLNFITKSKLCKYLLITYNIDQHIDSTYNLIPWLNWKEQINDYDIYKYFDFNNEEINLIENIIEKINIKKLKL